jgi:uncharacterized DUF497 family protein
MEKRRRIAKNTQTINGLGVSFEDAMSVFAQPVKKEMSDIEKHFGVPFNDGKTSIKIEWNITDTDLQRLISQ